MTIPMTISAASIGRFLSHIRSAGIPDKVTVAYIKSVGFRSSNDVALIGVFKALGFIDASGVPSAAWREFRDASKGKQVLAAAIRKCYSGLFQIYSDAYRKDDEAIANWIRSNSSLGGISVDRAVRTFKALSAEADFESDYNPNPSANANADAANSIHKTGINPTSFGAAPAIGPNVSINVELQIAATNDPVVYENFFAAMKKHLFDGQKNS